MKKTLCGLLVLGLTSHSFAATITAKSPIEQQLGYSYGYIMGRGNVETLKDLDLNAFIEGLKEALAGKPASLSDEEISKVLNQYKNHLEAQQMLAFQKLAANNLQEGQAFLAKNAQQSEIKTTTSGLQYKVLKAGTGPSPTATSKVKVNYEGRLLDGTVFDSSIARNHPVDFQLNQVIPGWTEGLQTMKEGGKTRFFIPSKLAYGETGSGDAIGPNSTLIFDVELLKVNP